MMAKDKPGKDAGSDESSPQNDVQGTGIPKKKTPLTNSELPKTPVTPEQLEALVKKINKIDLLKSLADAADAAKSNTEKYKFWNTQPVPAPDEAIAQDGPIEGTVPREQVRAEPYPLPKEFEWALIDIHDDKEITELYNLLSFNYVEDDDALFRFDYSAAFLKWGLQPPGWKKAWHIGVRVSSNKKLVAFISGVPATVRVRDHSQVMVEINFLCIHKKLRSKRLAPVLIKEVTRRVHLEGIFQALYTAGVVLPKPVSTCRYMHRSLNPKKLVETSFSHLGRNMTMSRMIRLFKLPENTFIKGLRPMQPKDVESVQVLLNAFLAKYELAPHLSLDEVKHWFIPVSSVVYSFVVEDPETHEITDFASFYSLPSSVIGHSTHKHINAAYLFYYAVKEGGDKMAPRLQALIKDMLILARNENFDVFNCLDLMDNHHFIEELKFGKGDGSLNYYLYNYRCREVSPRHLGLVLL